LFRQIEPLTYPSSINPIEKVTLSLFILNLRMQNRANIEIDSMLKPQDIPILLKTHLWQDRQWRYSDLAKSLGMSALEVHSSLKRSTVAKLYNPLTQQPHTPHLLELLIHGLKYIYPATPGTLVRGMPTAHGISPLK
jgi:hypothetical protein